MMDEFNSRMEAQRRVINLVNAYEWSEELPGLTADVISRWLRANHKSDHDAIAEALRAVSGALLSLAVKSQEQVSEEYQLKSDSITAFTNELRKLLESSGIPRRRHTS